MDWVQITGLVAIVLAAILAFGVLDFLPWLKRRKDKSTSTTEETSISERPKK